MRVHESRNEKTLIIQLLLFHTRSLFRIELPVCIYASRKVIFFTLKATVIRHVPTWGKPSWGTMEKNQTGTTTYAVLGSTGNCGTALIQLLLRTPKVKINAYCRNKAKLTRLLPEVAESKAVEIFEGSIQDADLLARCVNDCQAVFLVASTNDNVPGCRISQDLAISVIAALKKLKIEADFNMQMPKLVLLSSSTFDDHLCHEMPIFRSILLRAASNVYEDLRQAERFLRAQEDWVSTVFIKPGGLSVDVQRGHKLTLDDEESFLSYMDLAAGMIEAANDIHGQWDMQNVGVVNADEKAKFPPGTPKCLLFGLVRHYFPFLHPYLPASGPA